MVAVALVLVATGCSSETSWVSDVMTAATASEDLPTEMKDFIAAVAAPGEVGGCFGGIMEELDSGDPVPPPVTSDVTQGSGNDPYTATGARQLPGPNMMRAAPPTEPIYRVVVRPPDPNEHDPSGKAEGDATGPMPEPRILGSTSTSTTLSGDSPAQPDEAPAGQCG